MATELLQVALRVLCSYTAYTKPSQQDVDQLRAAASGPEAGWEADSLASYIIQRELKKKRAQGQ